MDEEKAVVHEDPLGVRRPFHAQRPDTAPLELHFDVLGQGLVLAARLSVHDDEKVGEGRQGAQVQDEDILGLFVLAGFDGQPDLAGQASLAGGWGRGVVLF